MRELTIAIDGFAACGKSTLAKLIAKKLNYIFVDSGAMYRAVTLYFIEKNIDVANKEYISDALNKINISFKNIDGKNTTFLNNKNVENLIREMNVSNLVSKVSAISEVRKFLVEQQRKMGKFGAIVMDGRDIGTVVFPNADLKLFLTADIDVRVNRRLSEINDKNINREEVKNNLSERDFIDSTRKDSPLKCATDAVIIDNSNLSVNEQFEMVLGLIKKMESV
jgi:cytidylate kinase